MLETKEEIAEELQRRLAPMFPGAHLDIQPWDSLDGRDAHVIHVRFTPKQPGPWLGFDLISPTLDLPLTTLEVKPWRKLRDLAIRPKKGPVKGILDYVVSWFKENQAALTVTEDVETAATLASFLRRELARLPGVVFEVETGPQSVRISLGEGEAAMRFEIVATAYASHFPPAVPGGLPGDMALRGKGPIKFRTRTGPSWSLAEDLLKWTKLNSRSFQGTRTAMVHRIVGTWLRG